jgi:hypothetical protein
MLVLLMPLLQLSNMPTPSKSIMSCHTIIIMSRQMLLLSSMTLLTIILDSIPDLTTLWVIIDYLRTTGNYFVLLPWRLFYWRRFLLSACHFLFFAPLGNYIWVNDYMASMHNDSNLWLAFVLCTYFPSSCLYNCHCYTLAIVEGVLVCRLIRT